MFLKGKRILVSGGTGSMGKTFEEIHHCIKRGAYYAIRPMLPELAGKARSPANSLEHEFSSADNVLSLAGTVKLLKQHKLLVGTGGPHEAGELLR